MRLLTILIVLACAAQSRAQIGEKMRHMLVGDTAAAPDHDTSYIAAYRSSLVISLVTKLRTIEVDLEQDAGDDLAYSTNSRGQYGFGLSFKWLSVEATFNVPALDDHDATLGNTSSRGFGLGYTGRRLWGRAFWDNSEGYYLNDPQRWVAGWKAGDAPIVRNDLSSDTYLLSLNYALSGKRRFSENAALFQMERQKKSAGTFVAGLSAWYSSVSADSSVVGPALVDTFHLASGFTGVGRFLAGATIGYTHTFAFWKKGFIHASVLPGLAYVQQTITDPLDGDRSSAATAAVTEFKLGAGFNGDRWYGAFTLAYYYSSAEIADKLSLSTNYGFVRFAIGIRLGDPGIKALGKVGL